MIVIQNQLASINHFQVAIFFHLVIRDTSMSTIYVDNSNLNSRCDFTVHVYEEVELPPSILINELLCADVTSIYFVIEDERADNVNVPFQHYAMNDCDPEPRRMLVLISSLLEVQQLM
jgi:hypothetical protein